MGSTFSRRDFLRHSAVVAAGTSLAGCAAGMSSSMSGMAPAMPLALPAPTQRQGEYADLNGARIFYQVQGQGTPMLLIHGYPLSGALFGRVRDALSRRFRVITLDQRGYGMSHAPSVPDSIAVYAQDALALLSHLSIPKAIIGGHSMGGPITLEMYQRDPGRFQAMVLIDTIAAKASPIEAGLWHGFVDYVKQNGVDQMYTDALIKDMLSGNTRVHQKPQVDYLSAVVMQASKDGAIGGAMALAGRPDYTALLGRINVPTLVYVGVEDSIYPVKIAQMMQQAIPNSKLAMIPGAAHAAIFEAPEPSTDAILDWAKPMM